MEDTQIIELYWQKDQSAIAQTADKYGAYCLAVADNILHNAEDSEECVNDTWWRAWNAMPPQRPAVLRMFLVKITRRLSFDRLCAKTAQKRGGGEIHLVLDELAECVGGDANTEAACEYNELLRCVERFVRGLPTREGDVFLRRYFFTEPIAAIARRYGMTENHVTVLLSRTRKKLRDELAKEGYV